MDFYQNTLPGLEDLKTPLLVNILSKTKMIPTATTFALKNPPLERFHCTNVSIESSHGVQHVVQHSGTERAAPLLHAGRGAPAVSGAVVHVHRALPQRTVEAPDSVDPAAHRDHTCSGGHTQRVR